MELEFSAFLANGAVSRDITTAEPDDVVNFLSWRDQFGKAVVLLDLCPFFGQKRETSCWCPKRLALLRSIFLQAGRTLVDSVLPGYGNPAASLKVKTYLSVLKEEQLLARTTPTQAEPFFISDLAANLKKKIYKESNQ